MTAESEDPKLKIIEITTFRLEGKYTDKRHPDEVKFAKTVEEDLSRRDFTVNAMALALTHNKKQMTDNSNQLSVVGYELVDPYEGQRDLKAKLLRTVGDAKERFSEDALRLMRAIRFAVDLDFKLEEKTRGAIESEAGFWERYPPAP